MLPPQADVTIFFLQISFFPLFFYLHCTHVACIFFTEFPGLNTIISSVADLMVLGPPKEAAEMETYIITSASDVMANCHTTKRLRQQKRRHDQAGVTWSSARGSSPPSAVHSSNGRAEFSDQVCYPAATSAATCGSACHTPVLFLRRWCHGLTRIGSRKGDLIKLWCPNWICFPSWFVTGGQTARVGLLGVLLND